MNGRRRLSEIISEGEGISLLVQVADAAEAASAELAGAEAVVAPADVVAEVARATSLPVLARGGSLRQAAAAGVDAWLLVAEGHEDDLGDQLAAARQAGLECVVDVRDDHELERVLEEIDAEIVLLSPRSAEHGEEAVDRVLELLPDVPAGMLVVAELGNATDDEVLALERAGVDAVLVSAQAFARLETVRPPAP